MLNVGRSAGLSALLFFSLSPLANVFALDKEKYIELASATIKQVDAGFVPNVHNLIRVQEDLVRIGIVGAQHYIAQHPEHSKLINEVINNVENMKRMSLDQIEDQWHMGNYLKAKGYNMDQYDHFGEVFSLMDAIIHPATSYISLKEYKRTRDVQYLIRASAELSEVLVHVKHIKPGADADTQLSSN